MKKIKGCKNWFCAIAAYKKSSHICETCLYQSDNETPHFIESGLMAIVGCPAKQNNRP
jgi:hypothetical protein